MPSKFLQNRSLVTKQELENISTRLGLTSLESWLEVDPKQIPELTGLKKGQLCSELEDAFPDHTWKPWLFQHDSAPFSYWTSKENRRAFFDWLFAKLGLHQMESRYSLTLKQIHQHGGSSVMVRFYNDSVYNALVELYPEHCWSPWLFVRAPVGIWKNKEVKRDYMLWLAKQQNIKFPDGWYSVSINLFRQNKGARNFSPKFFHTDSFSSFLLLGGGMLFVEYKDSVANAIMDIFPEHDWAPWKFRQIPNGFWDREGSRRQFFDTIASELSVRKLEDWYSISVEEVRRLGGGALVTKRFYNLGDALKDAYPDHQWDMARFGTAHTQQQRRGKSGQE